MRPWFRIVGLLLLVLLVAFAGAAEPALRPVVEVEEDVYQFRSANNGAGPLWCFGSTCLVRIGEQVFASGLETLPDAKPLNNCRWQLFARGPDGWKLQQSDPTGRTREPCPLAGFPDGRLLLSANPTVTPPDQYSGPARPEILQFQAAEPQQSGECLLPTWDGQPLFTEHSYRSLAADGERRELILFQNIGHTHAEWSFRDSEGRWSNCGKLVWPYGAEYEQPQPIRICYPNVMLKNRAVYFCGVSDIIEPYTAWREYKTQLTGQKWDYDFRRLFFTWTDDITSGQFRPWIEIASRDKTCGWIFPGDLWVAPGGDVHLLWNERALDTRLREKFFPDAKQSQSLNHALVRGGQVVARHTLLCAEEGGANEVASGARFHVTPDHSLFVITFVSGTNAAGQPVSENRLIALSADGTPGPTVTLPLTRPFHQFFTATVRAGSPPSPTIDLLGTRTGSDNTISYARLRLP